MTVLVTGATGLVGNNVVRQLVERGETVKALIRKKSQPRRLEGLDVTSCIGDVTKVETLTEAFRDVSAVIHCAALVHIGWSKLSLQREVNVVGTRNVAKMAQSVGARMVHVSSVDALAPATADSVVDETTPYKQKVPCGYVVTKREAELALQAMVDDGLDAVTVNPTLMFGPWDWTPSSGQMLLAVARNFALLSPPGGLNVCDVRDVAGGILSALEVGQTGRQYILGGENMTYFELWRLFAEATRGVRPIAKLDRRIGLLVGLLGDLASTFRGGEFLVNSAAARMGDLFHYYSSDRAKKELGYQPRPAKEAIEAAWEWFREYRYV